MNNRFGSFVLAMIHLMAFFIIAYAIRLATSYDPDIRGTELVCMSVVWLLTFGAAMIHMYDVIFPRYPQTNKEY